MKIRFLHCADIHLGYMQYGHKERFNVFAAAFQAVIDKAMPMWVPEECPLCQAGSEAIRPKGNWDRLTADY